MKAKDSLLVLAIACAAAAGAFLLSFDGTPALAEGKVDAASLIAFPVAINSAQEAVCVIDAKNGIMATYEITTKFQITLKSAREIAWDMQLREYNTDPTPDRVKQRVEALQKLREKAQKAAEDAAGKK